jgi:hypothetical protein
MHPRRVNPRVTTNQPGALCLLPGPAQRGRLRIEIDLRCGTAVISGPRLAASHSMHATHGRPVSALAIAWTAGLVVVFVPHAVRPYRRG